MYSGSSIGVQLKEAVAVLGKKFCWGGVGRGAGPSSFGRQQRLSEITIEPIKNGGAGQDLGPWPQHRTAAGKRGERKEEGPQCLKCVDLHVGLCCGAYRFC